MSQSTTKPKRKLTSLELPAPARDSLRRIKQIHGLNNTVAVTRGIFKLEAELLKGGK